MTDIALRQSSILGTAPRFDFAIESGDLAHDDGLRAAVLVSLFTDRRAEPDDTASGEDRRGWWADAWSEVDGDRIGSRLWLLARAKETATTLERARAYTAEALAWMIEDGIARAIEIEAEWAHRGMLGLRVAITLTDGSQWADRLVYPMQ